MPLLDSGPRRHAQPGQLGTLILAHPRSSSLSAPLLPPRRRLSAFTGCQGAPSLIPRSPGDLRDRTAVLPHQSDRPLLEVLI